MSAEFTKQEQVSIILQNGPSLCERADPPKVGSAHFFC